jgi:hypothetical protein
MQEYDDVIVRRALCVRVLFVSGSIFGCGGSSKQTSDAAVEAAAEVRLEVAPEVSPMMAAAALDGLRWQLPCADNENHGNGYCDSPATDAKSATLSGNPGARYDITLRFRGVVEEKTYLYGTADGHWQAGGVPNEDLYNVYKLEIAAPAQTYYLNAGQTGLGYCVPIDYTKTVQANAGALVSLTADSIDSSQVDNHSDPGYPLVVPEIAPAPDAYNGQFIQMDVVSVTERP